MITLNPSRFGILAALAFSAVSATAATGLDVGDKTGSPGATVEVAITLEATEEAVAGIQFDLSFDGSQLTSQPAIVGSAQSGDVATRSRETQIGRRRVLVYSTTASPLSEGQVVRIPFTINDDTPFDDYALTLIESAAILAKQDATAFDAPTLSNGMITVQEGPATVQISGTVRYYGGSNEPIKSVQLIVAGDVSQTVDANDLGAFGVELDAGSTVTMIPFRQGNDIAVQGVNVGDIITIRNDILSLAPITSPAAMLAADADRSNQVNVGDVITIRNVILGLQNFFSGGAVSPDPVFRFFDASLAFADPRAPWDSLGADDVNAARAFNALASDLTNQDFTGVKLGDANGDWVEPSGGDVGVGLAQSRLSSDDSGDGTVTVGSAFFAPGDSVAVPIYVDAQTPVLAIQFTVQWDPEALRFSGIENFALNGLSAESHLNLNHVADGILNLVWDDPALDGIGGDGSIKAINLLFDPVAPEVSGSVVQLTSAPTALVAAGMQGVLDVRGQGGYVAFHGDHSSQTGFGPYPVALAEDGAFTIWYPTSPGARYTFEMTNDLGSGEWTTVKNFTGSGRLESLSSSSDGGNQGFYRVLRIDSAAQ